MKRLLNGLLSLSFAGVLISMVSTNTTKDVTNSSVTLVKGSKDVVFRAIPTHKSLFSEAEVQWYFVGKNDRTVIPVGVMVGLDKLSLTFNTILNTEEQEGNYTITFGDYSTSFMLGKYGFLICISSAIDFLFVALLQMWLILQVLLLNPHAFSEAFSEETAFPSERWHLAQDYRCCVPVMECRCLLSPGPIMGAPSQ